MEMGTKCAEHPPEQVRFYCEECNVVTCDDCVTDNGKHGKCRKIKIKEYEVRQRQSMENTIKKASDEGLLQIDSLIRSAKKIKESESKAVDEKIRSVKRNRELIKKLFDELEKDLVENLEASRKRTDEKLNEFIIKQKDRYDEAKAIIDKINDKDTELTSAEITQNNAKITELLNMSDIIPQIETSIYKFNSNAMTKDNLQIIIGHLYISDEKDEAPLNEEKEDDEDTTESDCSVANLIPRMGLDTDCIDDSSNIRGAQSVLPTRNASPKMSELHLNKVKSYKYQTNFTYIVPQANCFKSWLVGSDIWELDLSKQNPSITNIIPSLDGKPFTAARSKAHGLLIGLIGKRSIRQLQTSGTLRKFANTYNLSPFINAHSNHLSAICTASMPSEDIILCLRDYLLTGAKEKTTVIRWYSDQKLKSKELVVPSNIDIKQPVHIAEYLNGDICITCSPVDQSSWIIIIDKNGKQKIRYPPNDNSQLKDKVLYSFIGAGFLKDGNITILDRVRFRQHLVSPTGEVLRIDSYNDQPSCFAVEGDSYIWVGFDSGEIRIMEYNTRIYEDVE